MKRVLVSLAMLGAAGILLSACVYDPYYYDRPHGRYYGPPPPGAYGPPPPANYNGPPPDYTQGPPHGRQLTPRQIAKMNDPNWCNAHPQRCAQFRSMANGAPPPQNYGPPPGAQNGPPPPDNGQASGPPQQMPSQQ